MCEIQFTTALPVKLGGKNTVTQRRITPKLRYSGYVRYCVVPPHELSCGIPEEILISLLPLLALTLPHKLPLLALSSTFCVLGVWENGGPCPVSHFCPEGTSFPLACLAGTYNNLTRQAACFPCAAGYYCPENTTSYSANPCPAGFYCPRGEMGPGDKTSYRPGWNNFLKAGSGPCEINLQPSVWFFIEKEPDHLNHRQGCHLTPPTSKLISTWRLSWPWRPGCALGRSTRR